MPLLALIKKGGLANAATLTPATIATHGANQTVSVAAVDGVTVTAHPETNFYPLTADEESKILAWLAHINETNQETIDFIISNCRIDLRGRLYLLKRSEEVPGKITFDAQVTCCDCTHFKRIFHPHLGHCAKGELEAIAGLWDDGPRFCESYSPALI